MTLEQIIQELKQLANPAVIEQRQKKFGIISQNALGVNHKALNQLLKKIPKDDGLALALLDTSIYEARLLCSKLFNPTKLTEDLMDTWVTDLENWEMCDSFSMKQFARSKYAVKKIFEWSTRTAEFEKRAAFATMAAYCSHDKKAPNDVFTSFFPLIEIAATDDRLYVKKAVNWALRSIGKRNRDLQEEALLLCNELLQLDNKTATWIAKDALKELMDPNVRMSDYPRHIYRI